MARTAGKASWIIEPLAKKHDRAAFSCGHDSLDNYIKTQASQDARRHAAAPFVALQQDSPTVLGYYTLSSIGIDLKEIPAETAATLPRYPIVPATLLGRLAVDQSLQGKGLGEHLLMDALNRAHVHSSDIASAAIVVDAIDPDAARFYKHFDFLPLVGSKNRLFLPINTISNLFNE